MCCDSGHKTLPVLTGGACVPLLVDNAHGAYLPFLPGGSRHPIALGAAMCCDSGHKTLPVLTGGAYLHLGKNAPVSQPEAVRGAMALFGSTSPSYLILQSLDLCNRYLAQGYREKLAASMAGLDQLRKELNMAALGCCPVPVALSGPEQEPLKLTLDAAALGRTGQWLADQLRHCGIECEYADIRNVVLMFTPENPPEDMARVRAALLDLLEPVALSGPEQEPLKLTLDAAALGRTGQWLADQLRHCGIECEYADIRNVVLMFTPENPPEDMARVRAALLDLLEQAQAALLPEDIGPAFAELASQNKQVRSIRAAVLSPAERVPVEQALGRVCALPTVSCPPAIPIAVSGEQIGPAAVALMHHYGVAEVAVCKE